MANRKKQSSKAVNGNVVKMRDVKDVDVHDDDRFLDHGIPEDLKTLREKWYARELCIDCLFQLSNEPVNVAMACWDFDDMFQEENGGQVKQWLKRVGNLPVGKRKVVWGYIKARLGLELPAGILVDESGG